MVKLNEYKIIWLLCYIHLPITISTIMKTTKYPSQYDIDWIEIKRIIKIADCEEDLEPLNKTVLLRQYRYVRSKMLIEQPKYWAWVEKKIKDIRSRNYNEMVTNFSKEYEKHLRRKEKNKERRNRRGQTTTVSTTTKNKLTPIFIPRLTLPGNFS
ncbi:uncharacterized protein LOC142330574 [Lycorma delicatula]|uniref:uncharacterized protein LOC142330574 n=1 Tax=Lycorma delicatula TaxID=130591 RepID=UPI003F50E459